MKKIIWLFTIFAFFFPQLVFSKMYTNSEDINWFSSFVSQYQVVKALQNIEELTDDKYTGRQSGTSGCNKSAQWIAEQFKSNNLLSYQTDSYFQSFEVPFFDVLNTLQFSYKTTNGWRNFKYKEDFVIFPKTSAGEVNSDFIFVGYGLTNETESYDDYAQVMVKGKVVLVIDDVPSFSNKWKKNKTFDYSYCIDNAIQHEASGIVFITSQNGGAFFNNFFKRKWCHYYESSIPCLYLQENAAINLFSDSKLDYKKQIRLINETQKPASLEMEVKTRIELHIDHESKKTQNVIGYIPAIDPSTKKSIVIGSHYDGLGIDQINGDIYRGANDNGSGTGVMLEISRLLQNSLAAPQVNIVFIAFSGEEEGLVGSSYYVSHPLFPIDEIITMINLDQIGCGNEKWIIERFTNNNPYQNNIIEESGKFGLVQHITTDNISETSDHYSFFKEKVPVIHIYKYDGTNVRFNYHTKYDTLSNIDPNNLLECGKTITMITFLLGDFISITLPELKKESVFIHPKIILKAVVKGLLYTNKKLFIESFQIDLTSSQSFQFSVPLEKKETTFRFIIKSIDNKELKELPVVLTTDNDPSLATDFDFNKKTDFQDFIAFSKVFNTSSPPYSPLSLYDLNNDEKIDQKDFNTFIKNYEN